MNKQFYIYKEILNSTDEIMVNTRRIKLNNFFYEHKIAVRLLSQKYKVFRPMPKPNFC